jgi:hypothetical protein
MLFARFTPCHPERSEESRSDKSKSRESKVEELRTFRPSTPRLVSRGRFLAALGMTFLGSPSPRTSLLNSTQTAQRRGGVPQIFFADTNCSRNIGCSVGVWPAVAGASRSRTPVALTPPRGVSTLDADLKVGATRKELHRNRRRGARGRGQDARLAGAGGEARRRYAPDVRSSGKWYAVVEIERGRRQPWNRRRERSPYYWQSGRAAIRQPLRN